MSTLAIICQIAIALGIFNVWIVRYRRWTPYRPDGAGDMEQEFRRYGLPEWARVAVGSTKIAMAALLLIGIAFAPVALPAAAVMALLMLGAIAAHVRVGDPLRKSVPAFVMLLLSTVVVAAYAV